MTNLNNNELSARTNLHNFCNTVKAGLHNAVVSPSKRHALLVLLLLGAALCAAIYWPYHLPAALAGLMLVPAAFTYLCWAAVSAAAVGYVPGALEMQHNFARIGFTNSAGEAPYLIQKEQRGNAAILTYHCTGFPVSAWIDKQLELESALNMLIASVKEGDDRRTVSLCCVPPEHVFDTIEWHGGAGGLYWGCGLMTTLPDIPRLYTALAEVLAALMYAHRLPPRMDQRVIWGVEAGWTVLLGAFLQATGKVPLAWWIPCMAMAILSMLLFLWVTRSITLLEAGYVCARAFILAELAASVEWQLHCVLWPQRGGAEPLSLLLLAAVYGGIFAAMLFVENRRPGPAGKLKITPAGTFVAVVMALTAFAVSNLSFANGSEANMNMFYIRTLVDLAGVLILTVQHEQLREAALHSELAELDGVLHRQYEQYKQSKENIRLINRRYHELKMQIAAIRAERDHAKQDVALAAMESGIRQYEAENKTGNPVLDTLLTAKSLYCQQHHITMTCVADGHLLDFLETGEICTIVGTALDNATESVETEPDHEKRLIRVAVYAQNGFVMLRFENYCAQEVELGADGLPRRNTHGGSDLRSVRAAAEKRGGTMTLHWENGWFTLRVLLPQKS